MRAARFATELPRGKLPVHAGGLPGVSVDDQAEREGTPC